MNVLVTMGPTQPPCHRRPLARSTSTVLAMADALVGAVPGRKISLTVLRVVGPGSIPVNASTVLVTRPLGLTRAKPSIGMPLETSDRMADHRGAEVSRDSLPSLGELSELPSQTPATRAGRVLLDGGARKPNASTSRLSLVVPVLYLSLIHNC